MKNFKLFFVLFLTLFSAISANFEMNEKVVKQLKAKKVNLIILRNFQSTNNVLGIVSSSLSPKYELTPEGIAMLTQTVPFLKEKKITRIFTASSYRTQQTANLLGTALQIPVKNLIVDPRLDIQNFGDANGEDFDLYKARFTSFQDMLENTPPHGETGQALFNRSQDFLSSLSSFKGETILIVTHAFNYSHISKCLTGEYGEMPSQGGFIQYP